MPAAESFRDCEVCPEMVTIPSGSFLMGSPESEEGRHMDEGPQHAVTIAGAFAVGRYEVTFDEWDGCARRVLRGGSWADVLPHLRTAVRNLGYLATSRSSSVGLRVARE